MAKSGRPRSFDRDAALEAAMMVFWEKGYEGTSLEELQRAMGAINPPSFYHAFGSKEALFDETVELYERTVAARPVAALENAPSARAGVCALLRATIEIITGPRTPHSCLLMLGAVNCAPANKAVEERMRERRRAGARLIGERIERGIADGDLPRGVAIEPLASLAISFAHGLPLRARDGASRADLLAGINGVMAAWDAIEATAREPAA